MAWWPMAIQAADGEGNYSVRGAGSQSCGQILELVETQPDDSALVVNWMDGYVSAVNRLQPQTYHATPFVGSLALTNVVLSACINQQNDDVLLEAMTAAVLERLHPVRETGASQILELEHDGNSVRIRQDSLFRIQERLAELGLYTGGIDGLYGAGTRRGLESFQRDADLTVTGLPDAETTLGLLLAE